MSIILNETDFFIKNVFFDNEPNKNIREFNSSFSRIKYSTELMTLKNICIKFNNQADTIEELILKKYLSYITTNKPNIGATYTPCYSIKSKIGFNQFVKISGIWENNSGTFGIAYKTF
jgi:hypothetical protein